jgi:hypothetical protein
VANFRVDSSMEPRQRGTEHPQFTGFSNAFENRGFLPRVPDGGEDGGSILFMLIRRPAAGALPNPEGPDSGGGGFGRSMDQVELPRPAHFLCPEMVN